MKNKLDFNHDGKITVEDGKILGKNILISNDIKKTLEEIKKEIVLNRSKDDIYNLKNGYNDYINTLSTKDAILLDGKFNFLFNNNLIENKYSEITNEYFKDGLNEKGKKLFFEKLEGKNYEEKLKNFNLFLEKNSTEINFILSEAIIVFPDLYTVFIASKKEGKLKKIVRLAKECKTHDIKIHFSTLEKWADNEKIDINSALNYENLFERLKKTLSENGITKEEYENFILKIKIKETNDKGFYIKMLKVFQETSGFTIYDLYNYFYEFKGENIEIFLKNIENNKKNDMGFSDKELSKIKFDITDEKQTKDHFIKIKNELTKLLDDNNFSDSGLKIKNISKQDLLKFSKIFEKYSKNNNILINIEELISDVLYFKTYTHFDNNFIKILGKNYSEIIFNINFFKQKFGKDFLYKKYKEGFTLQDLKIFEKYSGININDLNVLENNGIGIKELNYLYEKGNYSEEKIKLFLNKNYSDELLQKFIPNQTIFEKQKSNNIIEKLINEKNIPDYMVLILQKNNFFEEIKKIGYTEEYILEVLSNIKKNNDKDVQENGFMGENYKIYHIMILHNRSKKGLNNISTKNIFDTIAKMTTYQGNYFENVENLSELGLLDNFLDSDFKNIIYIGKNKKDENIYKGYIYENIKNIKKIYLNKTGIKNITNIEYLIKKGISPETSKKILNLFIKHGYYDKGGNNIIYMLGNNRELNFEKLDSILNFFDKEKVEISNKLLLLLHDNDYNYNKISKIKKYFKDEENFKNIIYYILDGDLNISDIKFAKKVKEKYGNKEKILNIIKMLNINKKSNYSNEDFEKNILLLQKSNISQGLLKDFNNILGVLNNYKITKEKLLSILELFKDNLGIIKNNNRLLRRLFYKSSVHRIKNMNNEQKKEFIEFINKYKINIFRIGDFIEKGFNLEIFEKNKNKLIKYLNENKDKNFITKKLNSLKEEELDNYVYRFTINDFDLKNFSELDGYADIAKNNKYIDIINENNKKSLIQTSIDQVLFNLIGRGVKPEIYTKILENKTLKQINYTNLGILNSDLYNNDKNYLEGLGKLEKYIVNINFDTYSLNRHLENLIGNPCFENFFKYLNKNNEQIKIGNKIIKINGNFQLLNKLVDFAYRIVLKDKSYTEDITDVKIKEIIKLFEKNISEKLEENFEETIFLGSNISLGYDHNTFIGDKSVIEKSSKNFTLIDNEYILKNNISNTNKIINNIEEKIKSGDKILLYIGGHGDILGGSEFGKNISFTKKDYLKILELTKKYSNLKIVIASCNSLHKFDVIKDGVLNYNELEGNIMINSLSGFSTSNFFNILEESHGLDLNGDFNGDFNGDGKVSLSEMFTYAKIHYQVSPIIEGN